jgi:hypothetical protein
MKNYWQVDDSTVISITPYGAEVVKGIRDAGVMEDQSGLEECLELIGLIVTEWRLNPEATRDGIHWAAIDARVALARIAELKAGKTPFKLEFQSESSHEEPVNWSDSSWMPEYHKVVTRAQSFSIVCNEDRPQEEPKDLSGIHWYTALFSGVFKS